MISLWIFINDIKSLEFIQLDNPDKSTRTYSILNQYLTLHTGLSGHF